MTPHSAITLIVLYLNWQAMEERKRPLPPFATATSSAEGNVVVEIDLLQLLFPIHKSSEWIEPDGV